MFILVTKLSDYSILLILSFILNYTYIYIKHDPFKKESKFDLKIKDAVIDLYVSPGRENLVFKFYSRIFVH